MAVKIPTETAPARSLAKAQSRPHRMKEGRPGTDVDIGVPLASALDDEEVEGDAMLRHEMGADETSGGTVYESAADLSEGVCVAVRMMSGGEMGSEDGDGLKANTELAEGEGVGVEGCVVFTGPSGVGVTVGDEEASSEDGDVLKPHWT